MSKSVQISFFTLLFLIMLGMTLYASSYQNLFTEFDWSNSPQWFQATIVDFYINQIIIWLLVVKLESSNFVKLFWLIFMVCFGSMATCLYIIQRILRNKSLLRKE